MQGFFRNIMGECLSVLRRVAPAEFGRLPIYVGSQEQLTPGNDAGGTIAFTSPSLDLVLRPLVDWTGRGFAMVISETEVGRIAGADRDEVRRLLMGVTLHEASHFIDQRYFDAPEPSEKILKIQTFQVLNLPPYTEPEENSTEFFASRKHEFFGHGPDFLRIALHLKRRAEILCGINDLLSNDVTGRYSAIASDLFEQALADEPFRYLHRSFHEITKKAPPASFADCWKRALKLYEQESR